MSASLLLGVINGLNIALLALGLVLVYKAGRFVNFAHAQLGVVPALVLAKLSLDWGVTWWLAFAIAVILGALTGAAAEVVVIRRLAGRSRISLLIATIGLSQVLLALAYFTWLGPNRYKLHQRGYPLPFDTHIRVGGLLLRGQHVLIIVVVPLLAVGLTVLLKATTLGKTIRAAASNPDAAGLAGISVRRTATITWLIAGLLSAVSAVLASPGQASFDTQALGPSLLLRAVGAAAIAGFTNLPVAFAAGVGLGAVEGITLHYSHSGGAGQAAVLIAILVGLFVRSRAVEQAGRGTTDRIEAVDRPLRIPAGLADRFFVRRQRALVVAGALGVGLIAPMLPVFRPEAKQFLLALTLTYALVGVSLVVLTGWGGQVSLGQFGFLGVGALTAARLAPHGVSFLAAAFVGGCVSALIAVLVGLPALRLAGLTLAVTTLGLGVVGPAWLFRQPWFAPQGTISVPPARMAGLGMLATQRSVYYLALAVLVVVAVAASALRGSPVGRLIVAVRDNEDGAASFGVSPAAVKVSVFALSGFIAGIAGVLWLDTIRNVSLDLLPPQQSLLMLSIPVIGGITSICGAVLGAIVVYAVPALSADTVKSVFSNTLQFQLFIGGAGLLATQIALPGGIASALRSGWEHILVRIDRGLTADRGRHDELAAGGPVLDVRGVTVRFGSLTAVDAVSIQVGHGEIVGLIGANGAGKTTLINAIAGTVTPTAGSIVALGHELIGLGPEFRAHIGVNRTFQDARLFAGLTVRETILVALHRHSPVGLLSSMVRAPWVTFSERRLGQRADEIIGSFGLTAYTNSPTADLSTGTRRLCDLAAQVASGPKVLLLDEPTAGVAQREAEAMGPVLRQTAARLGCSMLMIEHDMPLMLSIADRVYCLEAGRVIAEGTPDEIRRNPKVIASYLGTSERDAARATTNHPKRPAAGRRGRRTRTTEERVT